MRGLRAATVAGRIAPVAVAAGPRLMGITTLLDTIIADLPNPKEGQVAVGHKPRSETEEKRECDPGRLSVCAGVQDHGRPVCGPPDLLPGFLRHLPRRLAGVQQHQGRARARRSGAGPGGAQSKRRCRACRRVIWAWCPSCASRSRATRSARSIRRSCCRGSSSRRRSSPSRSGEVPGGRRQGGRCASPVARGRPDHPVQPESGNERDDSLRPRRSAPGDRGGPLAAKVRRRGADRRAEDPVSGDHPRRGAGAGTAQEADRRPRPVRGRVGALRAAAAGLRLRVRG